MNEETRTCCQRLGRKISLSYYRDGVRVSRRRQLKGRVIDHSTHSANGKFKKSYFHLKAAMKLWARLYLKSLNITS